MSKARIQKIVLVIALLGLTGWVAYSLVSRTNEELLWGWRPFFLLLSGWLAFLIVVSRSRDGIRGYSKPLLLSCLSGVLLSLGFPPSPLTPLMFIGFVPLLMAEEQIRTARGTARWTVFKYAYNAFFIWNICTTWWVLNTSFLPGIVANVLNTLFMAMVFTAYHQIRAILGDRLKLVTFASLWIAFEYLHITWDISWPWLNLGHAFAQYPAWVQWYDHTGIFGGSLWILVTNFVIWQGYKYFLNHKRWNRSHVAGALALILIPVAVGVVRYYTYPLKPGDVEVVVVQPNFEPHYEKFNYPQSVQLDRFMALSRQMLTRQTDYLVFPETSFGYLRLNTLEDEVVIDSLRRLIAPYPDVRLVVGLASYREHAGITDLPTIRPLIRGPDTTWIDVQNSAIQIARGEHIFPYFKSKLVPGAEFYPFRNVLPFLEPLFKMLQGSVAGMTRQEERANFDSPVASVAPVICYESVYGEYVGEYIRRGANIIFIITNDGWWDNTPGHIQHLRFGALRAIEHRRPIARSANSGISCFVNKRGDILQPTEYNEDAVIRANVDPGEALTFYTIWGDVVARIAVFLVLCVVVLTIARALIQRTGRAKGAEAVDGNGITSSR